MATLPNWLLVIKRYQMIRFVLSLKKHMVLLFRKHRGLNNIAMLLAAEEGKLRGMYVMGEEMALVDSNANHVQHILANLDFLVVQDMFLSKQLVLLMLFYQQHQA